MASDTKQIPRKDTKSRPICCCWAATVLLGGCEMTAAAYAMQRVQAVQKKCLWPKWHIGGCFTNLGALGTK